MKIGEAMGQRIVAVAITRNQKLLIAKRNYGALKGYWEFPGGKVEGNETDEQCALREIKEEFSAQIKLGPYLGQQSFLLGEQSCQLVLYQAELVSPDLKLSVHSEVAWISPKDFHYYQLAPADADLVKKCFEGSL